MIGFHVSLVCVRVFTDLAVHLPAAVHVVGRASSNADRGGHEPAGESPADGGDHVRVLQRALHIRGPAGGAGALRSGEDHR